MSKKDSYVYTRALPCPRCQSESFRLQAVSQSGECRVDFQCRECGFKVHAIGDQLFRTCSDALVIWNEQKRTTAAA